MKKVAAIAALSSVLLAGCSGSEVATQSLPDKTIEYEITAIDTDHGAYGNNYKRISLTTGDDLSNTLCIKGHSDNFDTRQKIGDKVKVNPSKLSKNKQGVYDLCR